MRTDTIFYQLFLTFHSLLFELLGEPVENANDYRFTSAEIKEKAFRFDGIFIPEREDKPIYFVEVQFQNKPDFYWEFIAEINLYLNQYKPVQDWKAIALFAQRRFEVTFLSIYQQDLISILDEELIKENNDSFLLRLTDKGKRFFFGEEEVGPINTPLEENLNLLLPRKIKEVKLFYSKEKETDINTLHELLA